VIPGWTVSPHARERMHEMAVKERELRNALEVAELDYACDPTGRYPGYRVRVGGRLAVPYDPSNHRVVTVLWRGQAER
jgi:hypothetical protein